MNDGFDEQDLSQEPGDTPSLGVELSAQQVEIHRNLKSIGPEIAAYYLDGIRILQNKDLETAASLLAHVAREIDGGLRDILSSDEVKRRIQSELTEAVLVKLGNYNELKDRKGHIASILSALNIDGVHLLSIDDSRVRLAIRWIKVAKDFVRFAHRHGVRKSPRRIEDFEGLWFEFESVLVDLVGNYLNLLDRLDRIRIAQPTPERREVLRNLLESEARRTYFFGSLESTNWLIPLKEDGWFDPVHNPYPQEDPGQPGTFRIPTWHAFEYITRISTHSKVDIDLLVDIVNSIINYTDDNGERIENNRTDLQIIKIIVTLPTDMIESQHIDFMGTALKSKWKSGLVDNEIGQTMLPKFLDEGKRELTLALLRIILEVRTVDGRICPIMDEPWLEDALKKHGQVIANLCGVEAAQITLEQIRIIDREDPFAFNFIQSVESDISELSVADYTELIVSFTSLLYQFAEPNNIKMAVKRLLNEPHTIIRRIGVNAINHHYDDLKDLFWNWEGNPLDEYELKPEMYQLIQTNSSTFDVDEMEQVLQWIESTQG